MLNCPAATHNNGLLHLAENQGGQGILLLAPIGGIQIVAARVSINIKTLV